MIDLANFMGRLVMPRNALVAALGHGLMRELGLIPAARRNLDELEIKPRTSSSADSSWAKPGTRGCRRAACCRRAWCAASQTASCSATSYWVNLIGLGTAPCVALQPEPKRRWQAAGRRFLQVGLKGQRSDSTTSFVEDLSQCLISLAPLGSLLVVRPNRILMHDGPDRPGRQPDKRLSAAAGKVNGSPVSHSIIIDSQPSGARV